MIKRMIITLLLLSIVAFTISSATCPIIHSSDDIVVAIIDSGIDLEHSSIISHLIKNTRGEFIYKNYIEGETIQDVLGHGTHIAGIIIEHDRNAKILPIKIINKNQKADVKDFIDGLSWAIKNNADIVVMSFGIPFYNFSVAKKVIDAWNSGMILIGAAGNRGLNCIDYPASLPLVLSVGSINSYNCSSEYKKSEFSSTNDFISLVAPGENILSSTPTNDFYYNIYGVKKNMGIMSGTSQACAFVAGEISSFWQDNPQLNNHDIYNLATSTSYNITEGICTTEFGYGLINIKEGKKTKHLTGNIYGIFMDKSLLSDNTLYITVNEKKYNIGENGIFKILNMEQGKYNYSIIANKKIYSEGSINVTNGEESIMIINSQSCVEIYD